MKLLKRIKGILPKLFWLSVLCFGLGFSNPIYASEPPTLPSYINEHTIQTGGYMKCPVCGTKSRFTYSDGYLRILCEQKNTGCGRESLYAYSFAKERYEEEQLEAIRNESRFVKPTPYDQADHDREVQHIHDKFRNDRAAMIQIKDDSYDNSGHIRPGTILLTKGEQEKLAEDLTHDRIVRLSYQSRKDYAGVVKTFKKITKGLVVTNKELVDFGKCTNRREVVWEIIKSRMED